MNARLISDANAIPFLASTVIPKGVDPSILAEFVSPSEEDVEEYGRLASRLFALLEPETEERGRAALPAARPAPAVAIPMKLKLPPPAVAYPVPAPSHPYLPPAPPAPTSSYIAPFSIAPVTAAPAPVPAPAAQFRAEQAREQAQLAREFREQEERRLRDAQEAAQLQLKEHEALQQLGAARAAGAYSKDQQLQDRTNPAAQAAREQGYNQRNVAALDDLIESLERDVQGKVKEVQGKPGLKPLHPSVAGSLRSTAQLPANPAPIPLHPPSKSTKPGQAVHVDKYGYVMRDPFFKEKEALEQLGEARAAGAYSKEQQQQDRGFRSQARPSSTSMDYYGSMFAPNPAAATRTQRSGERSRSRSRTAATRSRSRSRQARSRSPRRARDQGRSPRARSRSRERSKSRDRRRRRSRERRRSRSKERRRRSKSKERSKEKRSRKSRSRSKEKRRRAEAYTGPPVPAFLLHPADRLFAGGAKRRGRREGSGEEVDETKVALEEALRLIRGLKADVGEQEQETYFVTLEAEVLDDGVFKQFTQLGAGSEDKVTGVFNKGFFRSILPTYMPEYDTNLILKNQQNLHNSLKLKLDEAAGSYSFQHVKKLSPMAPDSEEKALQDFISYLKKVKMDKRVVVFLHSRDILLPLLLTKLVSFDLVESFTSAVHGFCDFSTCMTKLALGGVWKDTMFTDLMDVYRQIMGKQWPRYIHPTLPSPLPPLPSP